MEEKRIPKPIKPCRTCGSDAWYWPSDEYQGGKDLVVRQMPPQAKVKYALVNIGDCVLGIVCVRLEASHRHKEKENEKEIQESVFKDE